jgi:hypothetical protein
VSGTMWGVVFSPWPFVIGIALTLLVLLGWFWRGGEPEALEKRGPEVEGGAAP